MRGAEAEEGTLTERGVAAPPKRGRTARALRWFVPFVVSAGLLAWVFSGIPVGDAIRSIDRDVVLRFLGPFVLFNVVSLWIEARCLLLVVRATGHEASLATAFRIKSASYLLSLLNYFLGAAGLSVLLRRHAGVSLADAAGKVFLITLFDFGSLLALVTMGITFLGVDTRGVRAGVVVALVGLIVAGFVFLRAPFSLGPLDRVRELEVFSAARTVRLPILIEMGLLRVGFVASFIGVSWGLFYAFQVSVPLANLVINIPILLLVSALPIAAAGLGTGQIVFVELFGRFADDSLLLAASLTLSIAMILRGAALGLVFAREYTREALEAATHQDEEGKN